METVTRHVVDAQCCGGAGCEECEVTLYRCACGGEWPVGGGLPWHADGCDVGVRDAEIARLRAIIEGRAVGPTNEETFVHANAGGMWRALRVSVGVTTSMDALDDIGTRAIRDMAEHLNHAMTWWALDATGRPCAWPVVTSEAP